MRDKLKTIKTLTKKLRKKYKKSKVKGPNLKIYTYKLELND
jgi:hypothetical protein